MSKFFVKDCPAELSIFDWIYQTSGFHEAVKDVEKQFDNIVEIPHTLDLNQIKKDTIDALDKFGFKGWQTARGDSKAYGGLSMVYNPDLKESVDPNQNTLGTRINNPDEFYYDQATKFSTVRNTYFDSYAFRKLAPCITESGLKNLINDFKLSPTRSRIGVLDAFYHDKVGEEFLWHKDETVFENLRINIPIETDNTFMFQLEDRDPIHLKYGNIYTWDTHLPHRVYATKKTQVKRVHLVLGFSPWIDYNSSDDSFVLNDFFGKIHPIDILLSGKAHPQIG
jgi:hypothetical protein